MCTYPIETVDVLGPHRAREWEIREHEVRARLTAEEAMRRRAERKALRRQFAQARQIGLVRRHREKEQRMAEKATRDPFEPWLNGFTYDQAYDGNTWILTKGEDFDQSPNTVAGKLRTEFERRYGALDVKVEGDRLQVRRTAPSRH